MQYFSTLDEAYGNLPLEGTIVKKVPMEHASASGSCSCKCKGYQETNTFLLLVILLLLIFK